MGLAIYKPKKELLDSFLDNDNDKLWRKSDLNNTPTLPRSRKPAQRQVQAALAINANTE
jgi:hypothetical protein